MKKGNKAKNFFLILFIALCVILCFAAGRADVKKRQAKKNEDRKENITFGVFPNIPFEFENAYILSSDKDEVSFLYSGKTFTLKKAPECVTVLPDNADGAVENGQPEDADEAMENGQPEDADEAVENEKFVADIVADLNGTYIIRGKPVTYTGKVINVGSESINIKDKGEISCSKNFAVYNIYGTPIQEKSANVLLGFDNVDFIVEDGEIDAAVITSGYSARNIRVLITDSGGNRYHHYVEFSCNTDYSVNYEDRIETYKAGEIITVDSSVITDDKVVTAAPNSPDGRLVVSSISKSSGAPAYRGTLEIQNTDEGFLLINELSLEEYLYAVVSSEMPSSYNMEALMAQAVCARGYAYGKMNNGAYGVYGAHLDDTTACQVYNNSPETDNSVSAVKATTGMVPSYNGEIIDAYYFSTSCGTTCINTDVWKGRACEYLNDSMETFDNGDADLSDEQDFRDFIDGKTDGECFEKDLPFYRWTVTYTEQEMSDAVNSVIGSKMSSDLSCFMELSEDGKFVNCEEAYDNIGNVSDIEVTKRGNSGIITEIIITGSLHTLKITGQSMMRSIMTPASVSINKQDGSSVSGWSSLPSPYYYVIHDGDTGVFTIHGGGFGHGVGMSQNGANILAENGYNYEEIVKHYYHNVEITQIYGE